MTGGADSCTCGQRFLALMVIQVPLPEELMVIQLATVSLYIWPLLSRNCGCVTVITKAES